MFENDTNPVLEIVANPDPSGINTSATVAKFTALATGQPFAGTETMHGADVGTFTITEDNAFVKIKVYKTVISDVGFKFATPAGDSTGEIKVANTLINEWEELTFDFTGIIGVAEAIGVDQVIVFPDFTVRNVDTINYFDDITFSDGTLSAGNDAELSDVFAFPNPTTANWTISTTSQIREITIFDVLGKKIFTSSPNTISVNLDATRFKTGLYLATVVTVAGSQSIKLLKQ